MIINGVAGAGKDTVVELSKSLLTPTTSVHNFSAVDEIKQLAAAMGWNGVKDEAGRRLLAGLKQLSIIYNDGPTKYLERMINQVSEGLIFVHIREPEEIYKLQAIFPAAKTLLIRREGLTVHLNGADNRTEETPYDYEIENSGTIDELKLKVGALLIFLGFTLGENRETTPR